jgi:protein-tyrosine phosphatase
MNAYSGKSQSLSQLNTISEVLPNLYLSGINAFDIENLPLFQQYGIKHILCCIPYNQAAPSHYDFMMNGQYMMDILYIPYIDYVEQDLWEINNSAVIYTKYNANNNQYQTINDTMNKYNKMPYMEIAYDFISNAMNLNEGILVHCMAGISRSSSAIIYYIMRNYGVDYNTALSTVKEARSIVRPNVSFQDQLRYFDTNRLNLQPTINVIEGMQIPDTYDLQRVITINTQLPPYPW